MLLAMPSEPERLTRGDAEEQLLYFTTSSLDSADANLWFISDRSGSPNVHVLDLASGDQRRLTDNARGRMWQYQGFAGEPGRGLAVWSVALDAASGRLYFIQDNAIRSVDPDGTIRELAPLPNDQITAFIDVSRCGRFLCVPTTDARALVAPTAEGCAPGGPHAIDQRCQDEGLNSFLHVYDTATGTEVDRIAVPRCWITHVQFRPDTSGHILYNHEWPANAGVRRMWLWDGERHRCIRPAGDGRRPDDWACHEVWTPAGDAVVYHGSFHDGPAMVGRWRVADNMRTEIPLPARFTRYGHFQIGPERDDLLVCDGYYEQDEDEPGAARWLSLQAVDWDAGTVDWTPLCPHGSPWRDQDDHPHPIFDHAAKHIYFTGSTPAGRRAVYRIAI